MKSDWIDYQGSRVFIAEYCHFGDDSQALRREVAEAVQTLAKQPEASAPWWW
jgi:hypothetical protein